jgi:hypothetical protein
VGDTCICATDHKEGYVLRKLQRGLSAIKKWCECWNIKINDDNTWAIYFSHKFRPPETHFTLDGWNIPFVNHVRYLGVVFGKRITWKLHIEMIEVKAFRIFIRIYSLFKSELLTANIKVTLHMALIRSVITYACPAWELVADTCILKLQHLCMYKGWAIKSSPCTATFNDLLCFCSTYKKEVLCTFRNFPRCTPVRDLHMAFNLPYVYN